MSAKPAKGRILWAVNGWDAAPWAEALTRADPARELALETKNVETIAYAIAWKQKAGELAGLPNLRIIFSAGAGVEHLLGDKSLPDVPIVRVVNPDLANRMSEYVVWQALDHLRQGRLYRGLQLQGIWREMSQPAAAQVSVGVMGLGELGGDAAAKLLALGFRVCGWSRNAKAIDGVTCFHGEAGLADFLGQSDIVVVVLPLTEATRGIVNAQLLARMKRQTPIGGPVLINAGRGGLQVEADILGALESDRLMAASLDVFETEPLPANSPLWRHPRVFVTPHAAAASDPASIVPKIVRQIDEFENGLPLRNLVDRGSGY